MENDTRTTLVTTTTTSSEADEDKQWQVALKVFLWVVEAMIIVVALVGNLLVVLAFVLYKRLRASVTNYFVISLAVSDILITAIVNPLKLDYNIKFPVWTHGQFMCALYTTLYLLAVPSSVINLCAVTVDRYLVLRMPLRYNTLMPPRRALLIIGCLWFYAVIWACLPLMSWNTKENFVVQYEQAPHCVFVSLRSYNLAVNFVNFLIPMVLLAVFWYFIYRIALKHAKRVQRIERSLSLNTNESSNSSNLFNGEVAGPMKEKKERRKIRRNIRGSRYIGLIVLLFYLCWLPYITISQVGNMCLECSSFFPKELYNVFLVLGFLNSALNPFLYPFHDKHFKQAFRDMWRKLKNLDILHRICNLVTRRSLR